MRFFFDNNLPPRLARAIDVLLGDSGKAVHLTDRFTPDTPDIEWISALASEGNWVIISGDVRITRNPQQCKAWQEANLTTFFLPKKKWMASDPWLQAANLVRWWPDIMDQARRVAPGAGFLVPFKYKGRFEQVKLS